MPQRTHEKFPGNIEKGIGSRKFRECYILQSGMKTTEANTEKSLENIRKGHKKHKNRHR